jgi:hypothetical protein
MAALPTTVFPRHPEDTLPITLGPSPPHYARPAIVRGQQCGQPERTSSDPASIARGQLCRYRLPTAPTPSSLALLLWCCRSAVLTWQNAGSCAPQTASQVLLRSACRGLYFTDQPGLDGLGGWLGSQHCGPCSRVGKAHRGQAPTSPARASTDHADPTMLGG